MATNPSHSPEDVHPTPAAYVKVAIVLAIVTALEVAIYYVGPLRSLLVPLLLVFAFVKFVLVALWFMHLRFDSPIFSRLFLVGIILTLGVFAVVLVNFFTRGGAAPAPPGAGG
jgi:cytochrome c oxidase subunit IV